MKNQAKTGQGAVTEVRCPNGHPNRPGEIFCQFCSAPLPTPEEIDTIVRQQLEEEARLKNEVNKWFGKEGELSKFLSQIEVPLSLLLLGAAAWRCLRHWVPAGEHCACTGGDLGGLYRH